MSSAAVVIGALKIRKKSSCVNTGDRDMVHASCTFLYDPLSVYQISLNYFKNKYENLNLHFFMKSGSVFAYNVFENLMSP